MKPIEIYRDITDKLDGWSYVRPDGSKVHDCALGSLIRLAAELRDAIPGDVIEIAREDGSIITRNV